MQCAGAAHLARLARLGHAPGYCRSGGSGGCGAHATLHHAARRARPLTRAGAAQEFEFTNNAAATEAVYQGTAEDIAPGRQFPSLAALPGGAGLSRADFREAVAWARLAPCPPDMLCIALCWCFIYFEGVRVGWHSCARCSDMSDIEAFWKYCGPIVLCWCASKQPSVRTSKMTRWQPRVHTT